MNFLRYNKFTNWLEELQERRAERKFKKKYPQWDEKYWIGDLEFVWGIKSYDCLLECDANMHTMNDIEIDYDHKNKEYLLSVETIYSFENENGEIEYLKSLLKQFEDYMDKNGLNKAEPYLLYCSDCTVSLKAKTIEELYTQFNIFVNGYISVYEQKTNQKI